MIETDVRSGQESKTGGVELFDLSKFICSLCLLLFENACSLYFQIHPEMLLVDNDNTNKQCVNRLTKMYL